jgi:hypothetical protein
MKAVVEYISENMSPGMIKIGVVIGGLVAIIGPLLIALGMIATGLSMVSVPLLAVVAGVAAFGVALYAAWEFGDKVLGPWLVELIEGFQGLWVMVKDVAGMVKDTLVGAFKAAMTGIKNFITSTLDRLWNKLTKIWDYFQDISKKIGDFNPLRGVGEAIGNKIGDVVYRAKGGPLSAGQPAIVGEQGPELFIPGSAGMVMPNHALQSTGGGTVIHQHFNGNMDMAVVAALKNMKPTFVKWAVEGVREDGMRRV